MTEINSISLFDRKVLRNSSTHKLLTRAIIINIIIKFEERIMNIYEWMNTINIYEGRVRKYIHL